MRQHETQNDNIIQYQTIERITYAQTDSESIELHKLEPFLIILIYEAWNGRIWWRPLGVAELGTLGTYHNGIEDDSMLCWLCMCNMSN